MDRVRLVGVVLIFDVVITVFSQRRIDEYPSKGPNELELRKLGYSHTIAKLRQYQVLMVIERGSLCLVMGRESVWGKV